MILSKFLFLLFWLFFSIKGVWLAYYLLGWRGVVLGGGRDSDYYHDYATGDEEFAVNLWPVILRWLDSVGLYSRDGVSVFLFLVASLVLPFLVANLSYRRGVAYRSTLYWGVALFISLYPTLIFYSMDVYRDVFMLFVFVSGLYVFRGLSEKRSLLGKGRLLILAGGFGWVLYLFRPYLGFGFLMALLGGGFFSFGRSRLVVYFFLFFLGLYSLFIFGFLSPLLLYREGFGENVAGTTFGITFSDGFVFAFIRSFFYQVFGFYFSGVASYFAFFVESAPFIMALSYVFFNRAYSDKFVDYLIVFFVVYSSVWVIGNDNLGTAVRLRLFSYIAIYVACVVLYQNKAIVRSLADKT